MLLLFCRLNRTLSVRPSVNDFVHISTLYVSIITKLSMKVAECSIFHYAKVKFLLTIRSGKFWARLSGQICPYFPNYLHNLYKILTHNFFHYICNDWCNKDFLFQNSQNLMHGVKACIEGHDRAPSHKQWNIISHTKDYK